MPVFAVCPDFVRRSAQAPELVLDVLFRFTTNNPLRIAVDSESGVALTAYGACTKESRSPILREWLKILGRHPTRCLEYINVDVAALSQPAAFIEIAANVEAQKCVVAWSLQDFRGHDAQAKGVEIIDRTQAEDRLRSFERAPDRKGFDERTSIMIQNNNNNVTGNKGSTVIVDSTVGEMHHIRSVYGADVADVFKEMAKFITEAKNPDASELFASLKEEVETDKPRKAVVASLWDGLVKIIPDVAKIANASKTISDLF